MEKESKLQKQTSKSLTKYSAQEQALNAPSLPMSSIRRDDGLDAACRILGNEILQVVKFLNVGKNMNKWQIEATAKILYEEYYFLKQEEIHLCFDNGKKGKYGTAFNRLDGQVLSEWLAQYCTERSDAAEGWSIQKHKQLTAPVEPAGKPTPEVQEQIEQIKKKIKKAPKTKPPQKTATTEQEKNHEARLWYAKKQKNEAKK